MVVKGLALPAAFEQFIAGHKGQRVEWLPKDDLDAYGNDWHGPMEFFANPVEMAYWSERLPELLGGETEEQVAERERQRQIFLAELPGSIPWITDFSHIVEIGLDYSGSRYCLDFRDDPRNPGVICYDHGIWRRVAPDFDTVVGRLEPYDGQDLEEREQEIERRRHPHEDWDETEPVWAQVPVNLLASGSEPVVVNGMALPAAFQAFLRRYEDRVWEIKAVPETSDFSEGRFRPIDTVQRIMASTHHLAETGRRGWDLNGLPPVVHEMANARSEEDGPGYLPGITDFSQIVQFGSSPSGLPFAFDFRENLQEPSVIYRPKWGVLRWRRLAPNWETFLHLLEGHEAEPVNVPPPVLPRAPLHRPSEGPGMMIVNGLALPASFEAFLERYPARVWDLKGNLDAYGQPIVGRIGRSAQVQFMPYGTLEQIKKVTAQMSWSFVRMVDLSDKELDPEEFEIMKADLEAVRPGFLPTITDYSKIIQFGRSPIGPAFCFDFRENLQEPSVIHMPVGELRWRKIAPNFETFICLLVPHKEDE